MGKVELRLGGVCRRGFLIGLGQLAWWAGVAGAWRTPGLGVPWLAEVQRPVSPVPQLPRPLRPWKADLNGQELKTLEQWQKLRPRIQKRWQELLGRMSCPVPKPQYEVLRRELVQGCIRELIRYEVEPGQLTLAYLLRPAQTKKKLPGVVVFHSTVNYTIDQPAGLQGPAEKHLGLHLAQRGWVALCPRCFLWQEKKPQEPYQAAVQRVLKRHPGIRGMAKMLWDAQRAVDLLTRHPQVDPKRIAAVGHSLGGKETLYLAAFDARVQVAVASELGIGLAFSNWDAPWYLGSKVRDVKQWPFDHQELLALVAPRPFLLLGGESADGRRSWPYVAAALEVYRLYGNPAPLGLLNHFQGHRLPPVARWHLFGWLEGFLQPPSWKG